MKSSNQMTNSINDVIVKRAQSRFPREFMEDFLWKELKTNKVIMAGNSLNASTPHDVDLYNISDEGWNFIELENKLSAFLVASTRNALTFKYNDQLIQLCNYKKPTLAELVESFDFAHVKVGVRIDYENAIFSIGEVYISEDWMLAHLSENSFYTGSEYPLSSMIRLNKYVERGEITGNENKLSVIKIFTDIVNRGYDNYEDFKDQLASIDLSLEDDEGACLKLYESLTKRGLVMNPESDQDDVIHEEIYNPYETNLL